MHNENDRSVRLVRDGKVVNVVSIRREAGETAGFVLLCARRHPPLGVMHCMAPQRIVIWPHASPAVLC